MKTEYKFKYIHKVCGKVAFIANHEFIFGEFANVNDVIFENGKHPVFGSDVVCVHCGKKMQFGSVDLELVRDYANTNRPK